MQYVSRNDTTKILIYSFVSGLGITEGPLVAFDGVWEIISTECANYYGRPCRPGDPTSADDNSSNLPGAYALHQNYPNPFNPTTTIEYDLPKSSSVRLEIYNITGQKVRTLTSGQASAGHQTIVWDGRDATGRSVSSGIYLYRLTAGEYVKTRKMLLMK
jgi:hypothetical protein